MNTVNVPLALFTIVLRQLVDKFVDKLRSTQTAVVVTNSPWIIDSALFKIAFYTYMFGAGLFYMLKHMRKGTIVSVAQKCSSGVISIKDRCRRRKYVMRDKEPWLLRNLTRNRESQQEALGYVAALLPHDVTNSCNHPLRTNDNSRNYPPINQVHNSNNQQRNSFATNPYFEPKVSFNRPTFNRMPPYMPSAEISNNRELPHITESPEGSVQSQAKKPKRKTRMKNYLTLRNRKIRRNELSCGEKIVRKTRNGKVYGYCT